MSKKFTFHLVLFVASILYSGDVFSQTNWEIRPAIAWQRCLGGTNNDIANDVLITDNGKIVVAGISFSNDGDVTGHHGTASTSDGWVVLMDTAGNVIWQRSVGGTGNDELTTIIAVEDGNFLCTGKTFSNDGDLSGNHGNGDVWAVKLSANGTVMWSKCFGGSSYDYGSDVTLTTDGGYAFIGTSYSSDGDVLSGISGRIDPDGWAFKTNAAGNIIWEKCLNYVGNIFTQAPRRDVGYCIARSETGNLYTIVTGTDDYQTGGVSPDIVSQQFGKLYELDNNTGNPTLRLNIGGDSLFSMYQAGDKQYFSFFQFNYNIQEHCFTNSFYTATRLAGNNSLTSQWLFSDSQCGGGLDNIFFGTPHGIAESPTAGTYIGAGNAGSMAIVFLPPYRKYQYGNTGQTYTNFNSIKVFPSGNEYIVAGSARGTNGGDISGIHGDNYNSDFWILKLQALNEIKGNVFLDANNNGTKDAGELPFNEALVTTTKQNFSLAAVPYNGIYRNVVDTGNFTTTININRPYYTATPISKTSVFSTYKNKDTANFAVRPIPGIKDFEIGMVALTQPRPGFNLQYKISYFNKGTTTLTNTLVYFIKDSRTQFLSAVPANSNISGDTIKWNISSLAINTGGNILVNLQLATIPTINIGDVLTTKASIDSIGDFVPLDNYFALNEPVSGSYDPNDKKESFAGEIYPADVAAGKYLNYKIRFQNTGNDTAFTIILRDTLDSKLNADSIEIIAASHPYSVNIKDKKYVTVLFNDIKLVDSMHNEPLSHGYFSYRIKPIGSLTIGDTIKNRAAIYFDFNPPIKTNTEITIYRPTPVNSLWTGAVSTAWENPLNWNNQLLPTENTNVIINTGLARYPIVSSNAVCRTITVKPGASVLIKTGFTMNVKH